MKRFLPALPVGLVALYLFTSFLVLAMHYTSRRASRPPAASVDRQLARVPPLPPLPPLPPTPTTPPAATKSTTSLEDTMPRTDSPARPTVGHDVHEPITLREVMVLGFAPPARVVDPGVAFADPPSRAWQCGAWRPLASGPETQSVRYCQ